MEILLTCAIIYMLWENWSLMQVINQLRYNQRNYIDMLTNKSSDTIDD